LCGLGDEFGIVGAPLELVELLRGSSRLLGSCGQPFDISFDSNKLIVGWKRYLPLRGCFKSLERYNLAALIWVNSNEKSMF